MSSLQPLGSSAQLLKRWITIILSTHAKFSKELKDFETDGSPTDGAVDAGRERREHDDHGVVSRRRSDVGLPSVAVQIHHRPFVQRLLQVAHFLIKRLNTSHYCTSLGKSVDIQEAVKSLDLEKIGQ